MIDGPLVFTLQDFLHRERISARGPSQTSGAMLGCASPVGCVRSGQLSQSPLRSKLVCTGDLLLKRSCIALTVVLYAGDGRLIGPNRAKLSEQVLQTVQFDRLLGV